MANLDTLKSSLSANGAAVTRWEGEVANGGLTDSRLKAIKLSLQTKITFFIDLGSQISNSPDDDMSMVLQRNDEIIDRANELLIKIDDELKLSPKSIAAPQLATKQLVNLPKLNLPEFDGTESHFNQFWELFLTNIDSAPNLTKIGKLTYLLSLLRGQAKNLLAGLSVTDQNYTVAKDILVKRFDNKQKIVKDHFDAILDLRKIGKSSASSKEFLDSLNLHIRSLQALTIDVDSHSVILVPAILAKLDGDLRLRCVRYLKMLHNDELLWQVSQLITCLDDEVCARDFCESVSISHDKYGCSSSDSDFQTSSMSLYSGSKPFVKGKSVCVFCNGHHLSKNCSTNSTFIARYNILRQKKLVFAV